MNQTSTSFRTRNILFLIILIIVGIAAIAGVCWYYRETIKSLSQPTPQTQATTTQDGTANWKTYRNEEFGFEVKYPETIKGIEQYKLLFHEFNPGSQEIFAGRIGTADLPGLFLIGFTIERKPSDFVSLDTYLTKIEDECQKEIENGVAGGSCGIKEMTVGNEKISAVVSREGSAPGNTAVTLYFDKGNNLFLVNYYFVQGKLNAGYADEEILFDTIQQILPTFKFIESVE